MSKIICGLDEVGRGALAGPLVVCGVVLKNKEIFKKEVKDIIIRDSKKMTKIQRDKAYEFLVKKVSFEIVIIEVDDINKNGISWANKNGFERIISRMKADEYIIDGNLNLITNKKFRSIVKADNMFIEVMMASIIAKVTRDKLMHNLHKNYQDYDWLNNVGYGTKKHIDAIKKIGKTMHHRDLFIRKIYEK